MPIARVTGESVARRSLRFRQHQDNGSGIAGALGWKIDRIIGLPLSDEGSG
jgi:hypothetical protein